MDIFTVLIFIVLLIVSDRIWRILEAMKKHNAAAEALLTEIRDSLKATR